jgi:hypothetical protein
MLPLEELSLLMSTIGNALDLAAGGRITDGYITLLGGVHRAEEMAAGAPVWAEELLIRWHQARDNYASRYAVATA